MSVRDGGDEDDDDGEEGEHDVAPLSETDPASRRIRHRGFRCLPEGGASVDQAAFDLLIPPSRAELTGRQNQILHFGIIFLALASVAAL